MVATIAIVLSMVALNRAVTDRRTAGNIARGYTNLYSDLRQAESSARGYVITGEDKYLEPYESSLNEISEALPYLKNESTRTEDKEIFELVSALSNKQLSEIEKNVEARRESGLSAAISVVKTHKEQRLMDKLQKVIKEVRDIHVSHSDAIETNIKNLSWITVIMAVLSLLFLSAIGYLYRIIYRRNKSRRNELQIKNDQLALSNQELESFAYVASHDLQEPLRKIQAFGSLLGQELADESGDTKMYLDRMKSAARRMSKLIDNLLSYSRVTSKASPFEKTDLKKLAEEVIDDLDVAISESDAEVKIGRLPKIDADPFQMRQLFQNLISNGIKFRRPDKNPKITISSKPIKDENNETREYQITIADNGIGFEQKYEDKIFNLFQRLHGRVDYKGTGIGLSICRKIVERHDGTIEARSSPGKGAKFVIKLPISQKEFTDA